MQFYESEAYYWLAVKRLAEILARSIRPKARGWPPKPRPIARI